MSFPYLPAAQAGTDADPDLLAAVIGALTVFVSCFAIGAAVYGVIWLASFPSHRPCPERRSFGLWLGDAFAFPRFTLAGFSAVLVGVLALATTSPAAGSKELISAIMALTAALILLLIAGPDRMRLVNLPPTSRVSLFQHAALWALAFVVGFLRLEDHQDYALAVNLAAFTSSLMTVLTGAFADRRGWIGEVIGPSRSYHGSVSSGKRTVEVEMRSDGSKESLDQGDGPFRWGRDRPESRALVRAILRDAYRRPAPSKVEIAFLDDVIVKQDEHEGFTIDLEQVETWLRRRSAAGLPVTLGPRVPATSVWRVRGWAILPTWGKVALLAAAVISPTVLLVGLI